MNDLDMSGLPLMMAKATSIVDYLRRDPRKMVARIFKRRILYSIDGGVPQRAFEMYATTL